MRLITLFLFSSNNLTPSFEQMWLFVNDVIYVCS